MLRTLRASASSWIVKILFLLLVASFAIWGIGDIFRAPSRETPVATVGDVGISGEALRREFRREMDRLQSLFGGQLDEEQARRIGLDRRVLDEMISRTLFDVFARQIGVVVPDALVRHRIETDRAFQNDLGKFDRVRFQTLLQRNGLTEQSYVALLRRDIAREQLLNAVTAGVAVPETLAKALYRYRAETRIAETLLIPDSSITDIGEPTDAQLTAFHKEHADRYQAPEYRSVTMVVLSPKDLAGEIKVSDEDLRAAYEDRRDELAAPERRHIEQIVFPDEAAAKAAATMLRDGIAFAEVAKRTTGNGPVDLGTVERKSVLAELAEPAFTTPKGQVSAPVKSPLGWHLLHVLTVEPAHTPSFAEVRDKLRQDIAMDRAVDSIIARANQLEDELAGGATLEEAATRLDLKPIKLDAVSAAGEAPDGTKVEAIANRPGLLSLAFKTPEGEESQLTETADGGYGILYVNSVQPPALRPLEDVRPLVVDDWKEAQRAAAAAEKAKAVAERIRGGEELATVASKLGLSVVRSDPFRRDKGDADANIPPDLAAELFKQKEGGVVTAPVQAGSVVARLVEVRAADPAAAAAEVKDLKGTLRTAMASDILAQFGGALRQDIEVDVNQGAVGALF